MTLFKARFSDSKYYVSTALLILTFSYLLFCFRIKCICECLNISQCHGGRVPGKSLSMDYNTGLNINVSGISGSCLGKRKIDSFTIAIQDSIWVWKRKVFHYQIWKRYLKAY